MGWHRLQGFGDHVLNLRVRDGARSARAWLIEQALQAVHPKSFTPFTDRSRGNAKPLCDLAVAQPVTAAEHNTGAHREGLAGLRPPRQHGQFLLLLACHVEEFGGASDGHTQVWTGPHDYSMNF